MRLNQKLECERLAIRDYEDADQKFCTSMWFDKENGKYLSDPTEAYVDEVYQNALDTMCDSQYGYYLVIEDKDSKEPVGTCCAFPSEDKKTIDIGYCINKAHWRKGYASEAVSKVMEWAKTEQYSTMSAEVAKENVASCGLIEKLGFTPVKEKTYKKYHMGIEFESYVYEAAL